MSKLEELYNFINQDKVTYNELVKRYPHTDYYIAIKEDDFIGIGTARCLMLMEIVKGEKSKYGGDIYTNHRKFVAVEETAKRLYYREVEYK